MPATNHTDSQYAATNSPTNTPKRGKCRFASIVAVAVFAIAGTSACTNPETPTGHEGYVYYVPLIFGKMEYRRSITGPASTGLSWRLFVTNIDTRTRNYKEPFELLTRDNLSIKLEVNTRIRVRSSFAKQVVEEWGGEHWYEWNVKERLRTIVRRRVMQQSASDIQLKTDVVRQFIQQDLEEKFKDKPIEIETVVIGHIKFPGEVSEAIDKKESKQQELRRQQFVLAKAHKEAAIRVLEALKVAKEQQIISSTLDPLYVQRRAVEVYRSLAKANNKTVILLPNTSGGTGMPLVMTKGQRKILTNDGRALLERMEKKYMEMAKSETKLDPDIQPPSNSDPVEAGQTTDKATDSAPAATPSPTAAPKGDATAKPQPSKPASTPKKAE